MLPSPIADPTLHALTPPPPEIITYPVEILHSNMLPRPVDDPPPPPPSLPTLLRYFTMICWHAPLLTPPPTSISTYPVEILHGDMLPRPVVDPAHVAPPPLPTNYHLPC